MTDDLVGFDSGGQAVRWRGLLEETEARLAGAGLPDPSVDARRIVEEASGFEGAELHLGLDEHATKTGVASLDRMVARRLEGEPLQYVLGRWAFRTLDLMVDSRVLIPRPETEIVAGVAVDELARQEQAGEMLHAVDLGTGSGAIGLSLAAERPDVSVLITDASISAIEVARANLAGLGRDATRVRVSQGDWFEAVPGAVKGEIAVVVSNPPYVAVNDSLPPVVADWEPFEALVAGERGTEAVEHIIDSAGDWIRPGGALVLEMAPHQTGVMAQRAQSAGYIEVEVITDLAGRDRVLRARWPS